MSGAFSTTGIFRQISNSLQFHASELARLQEQAATGRRINRVSDDPAAATRALVLTSQARMIQGRLDGMAEAKGNLSHMSSILEQVSGEVAKLRVLATQMASEPGQNEHTRAAAAGQVNGILDMMTSLASTQRAGVHLFSGKRTREAPYEVVRVGGEVRSITYVGTDDGNGIDVGNNTVYPLTVAGNEVFSIDRRGSIVFSDNTGVAAGTGNASLTGVGWVEIRHTGANFSGASGITSGAAGVDTVIGDRSVTIDDVAGTIQLGSGPVTSYTGAETGLQLTDENGDVIHVDVTGIVAGFQGTITATATGEISIDGGDSWTAIDGSANLAVTHAAKDQVLFVNSAAIQRTGADTVRVAGTGDLFETIMFLRDALENDRGLTWNEQTALLGQSLETLDDLAEGVAGRLASFGAKEAAIESVENSLEELLASTDKEVARLESVDIVDIATEIAQRDTLYRMTLATVARISGLSLLNFLQ